jgi:tyrosyl-tRNA synthetase
MKAPWELLALRVEYYGAVIRSMLRAVGVPLEKLEFVRGTDFQLSREYTLDVYRFSSMCGLTDAQRAGAEVVKQVDNPLLSGLLYPGLQALDEEYLKVDAQFGGQDQRKIFVLAKEYLPKLGYGERIHLMNPMVPGLTGNKMSSSDPDSKIDMLDSAEAVARKIKKAFCEAGNVANNGLLSFLKYVVFPLLELRGAGTDFVINRDAKWGGPIVFKSYAEVHEAFEAKRLDPVDLKLGVTDALNAFMDPVRRDFESPEMQDLIRRAYPEGEKSEEPKKADKKAFKAAEADKPVDVSRMELRAGKVLSAEKHPEADNLYVTRIDLGAAEPRTVLAGLAGVLPADQLQGRTVVVVCNLPPRKMKGIDSQGMILAAVDGDKVEVLEPAAGAALAPGTRVAFEGYPDDNNDIVLNPKKKIWEAVSEELQVKAGKVVYRGQTLATLGGAPITAKTIVDGKVQ